MSYRSEFYGVDVREEIVREFTDEDGRVDDMLAGLHEVRARLMASRAWPAPIPFAGGTDVGRAGRRSEPE